MQIIPVIDSVSHHSGSLAGGQLLSITGRGFGAISDLITVTIEDSPCEIVSVEDFTIKCLTSPWVTSSDKALYKGGAGIKLTEFDGYQSTSSDGSYYLTM